MDVSEHGQNSRTNDTDEFPAPTRRYLIDD